MKIEETNNQEEEKPEDELGSLREDILTSDMVKQRIIGDPVSIQTIIEALSERTRLFILKRLQNDPEGLTATEIAKLVNKRVPTILYHLERLRDAGVVFEELKPRNQGDKREIKHWRILNKRLTLDVDLETISYLHRTLESYILSFLAVMKTKGKISQENLDNVTIQEIISHQYVNAEFAAVIKKYLSVENIALLLQECLNDEFSKLIEIEKRILGIIRKNYLQNKAIPLMNKEMSKVFGYINSQILNKVSEELFARKIGNSQQFRTFIWEISTEYQLILQIPLRMTIKEIGAQFGVSLDIAVRIRNLLLSTGNYAVDRKERLFLR